MVISTINIFGIKITYFNGRNCLWKKFLRNKFLQIVSSFVVHIFIENPRVFCKNSIFFILGQQILANKDVNQKNKFHKNFFRKKL